GSGRSPRPTGRSSAPRHPRWATIRSPPATALPPATRVRPSVRPTILPLQTRKAPSPRFRRLSRAGRSVSEADRFPEQGRRSKSSPPPQLGFARVLPAHVNIGDGRTDPGWLRPSHRSGGDHEFTIRDLSRRGRLPAHHHGGAVVPSPRHRGDRPT